MSSILKLLVLCLVLCTINIAGVFYIQVNEYNQRIHELKRQDDSYAYIVQLTTALQPRLIGKWGDAKITRLAGEGQIGSSENIAGSSHAEIIKLDHPGTFIQITVAAYDADQAARQGYEHYRATLFYFTDAWDFSRFSSSLDDYVIGCNFEVQMSQPGTDQCTGLFLYGQHTIHFNVKFNVTQVELPTVLITEVETILKTRKH